MEMRLNTLRVPVFGACVVISMLAVAGCTNKPGALSLTVNPARDVFGPDEPIELRASLTAESDRVLLSESCWWRVDMENKSDNISLRSQRPTRSTKSHNTKSEIAAPFRKMGNVFDVGDSDDRFARMNSGDRRTVNITLKLLGGELYAIADGRGEPQDAGSPQSWTPGTYTVTVSLDNQSDKPAPLFYRPYKRRVEAECQIRIAR